MNKSYLYFENISFQNILIVRNDVTRKQSIIIWKGAYLIDSQLRLIDIKYLHSDETSGKR